MRYFFERKIIKLNLITFAKILIPSHRVGHVMFTTKYNNVLQR